EAGGVTSPEELIAAAHTACFAMQFAAMLGDAGGSGQSLDVGAQVSLGPDPAGGFRITGIELTVRGTAEGVTAEKFAEIAGQATAADRLAAYGVPVATVAADVTDTAALAAAVDEIADALGGLDHLVANVGGTVGGNLADSAPGDFTATFSLNAGHAAELIRSGL